jgi:hypothetical protein
MDIGLYQTLLEQALFGRGGLDGKDHHQIGNPPRVTPVIFFHFRQPALNLPSYVSRHHHFGRSPPPEE